MNIILKESHMQFKSPVLGQPSRAVEEHYYARRIVAVVDGEERQFRFMAAQLPFAATEADMIAAIEAQVNAERAAQNNAK